MIEVQIIADKYIVEKEQYGFLNQKSFGNKTKEGYVLDEFEVALLLERKKILVKRKNKKITLKNILNKKKFNKKEYLVFKDLRSKGYMPKTGLKYGTTFRLYDNKCSKKHSQWLLDVVKEDEKISFRNLCGKNRIANSTKKKLLIAIVDKEESITYVENNWKKL